MNEGSTVRIRASDIAATGTSGINNAIPVVAQSGQDASVFVQGSVVNGGISGIDVDASGGTARTAISHTLIEGNISADSGSDIKCIGAFDQNLDPLLSDCTSGP